SALPTDLSVDTALSRPGADVPGRPAGQRGMRELDLGDIKWDLGRFGKLHVRHGKVARIRAARAHGALINGADRTLRWFIEAAWG
ncbi:MAG: hypothetical protein ACRDTD_25610, partial [Pseudonocardiaceae bacterium]